MNKPSKLDRRNPWISAVAAFFELYIAKITKAAAEEGLEDELMRML